MANVEALNELPADRGGINLQQSSSNHFAIAAVDTHAR